VGASVILQGEPGLARELGSIGPVIGVPVVLGLLLLVMFGRR